jgi:hypothetical protein
METQRNKDILNNQKIVFSALDIVDTANADCQFDKDWQREPFEVVNREKLIYTEDCKDHLGRYKKPEKFERALDKMLAVPMLLPSSNDSVGTEREEEALERLSIASITEIPLIIVEEDSDSEEISSDQSMSD